MTPAVVLTDIEGTTTPIAFVRDVLFPYARGRLPSLLRDHASRPDVAAELNSVREIAPNADPLTTLLEWMDQDAKATPLKALQGLLWREGYESGAIRGAIYPDVAPALRRWHQAGTRIAVYSSGSEEAQRLLFAHSDAGDLAPLMSAYFDTRVGAKRETVSYLRIAAVLATEPAEILFLSDVEAELDAARSAGLQSCQVVRTQDGTTASTRHRTSADFTSIAAG